MTLKEQLEKLRATKKALQEQIAKALSDAITKGHTPNDEQEKAIKALEDQVTQLEVNEARLERLIAAADAGNAATPVKGQTEAEGANKAAPHVTVEPQMAPGIGYALIVKATAVAGLSKGATTATDVLRAWGAPEHVQKALVQKATIGTTTNSTFAAPLVELNTLTGEFIELLRKKTVVDRLPLRSVPFNVKMPSQTASGSVQWVGEGQKKPVTNPEFGSLTLTFSKVAGIVLMSDELLRFSNPKADALVRDDLIASTAEFLDDQFFDKNKAESTDSPAGILNGVTAITNTGTAPDKIEADLLSAVSTLTTAGLPLSAARWVMSPTRAAQISVKRDALGNPYFAGLSLQGQGNLMGIPVEITDAPSVADKIALVVGSEILLADDGQVDFAVSTEATINTGTDVSPVYVNLFQNNLTALRGERYIRWKKRRAAAATYIQY